MDKGKLKNFAGEARKRLIDHTGARIRYILTHDTPELAAKADLKEKLRAAWENTPDREEFIERHAYTLFNRLIALRYMDVKGYNFVPVVSPRVEGGDPAILADARKGLIPAGLPVDAARVKALLSGEVPAVNPFNEAYKLLFIAACAGFNKTMPFMFEPLNSYTEILLPDDLLSANSILAFVNENLGEEECENVEVIGWLYQFYISEKKDAVFADKKNAAKRKKDEIAAITQLFTPAWIVKYLVENGLGKLWMLNNPASPLQQQMSYYLPTELVKDEVPEIKSPEEIKILDPCAGSGHTLVYAFDLLFKIYEESGYYRTDIPALILRNNLTGLELDNRAAALADFALMMKAMEYDRNFLTRGVLPKVYSLNDERIIHTWEVEGAVLTKKETQKAEFFASFFKDADILGSLLDPGFTRNAAQAEFFHDEAKKEEIESRYDEETTTVTPVREKVEFSTGVYNALSAKYHFTVTNPPYLPGNSNPVLKKYLETHYPASKSDLFAAFIERCVSFTDKKCFTAMITQHAWMFLSSFEKLRERLLGKYFIDSMAHLGARAFEEIGGEVVQTTAFIFNKAVREKKGLFVRLVDIKDARLKETEFLAGSGRFYALQSNFSKIPGAPIAYWVSEIVYHLFELERLENVAKARIGMITTDNERFLRQWNEVAFRKIGFNFTNIQQAINSDYRYYPYNKGGSFRKWYGNNELIVNWQNGGREIKENGMNSFRGLNFYFKEGLTWTFIGSGNFGCRYKPEGFIFDIQGSSAFPPSEQKYYICGLLCSKISSYFLHILNPSLSIQAVDMNRIPYCNSPDIKIERIDTIVLNSISISREDWDARETSWDFRASPLLAVGNSPLLEERYAAYKAYWSEKFHQLHRNEEELNRIFIDIYGLQNELTPDVALEDVTILQPEKIITPAGELDFKTEEVVKQFISYAVGCMFGRYSLDKPGLILANQGETLQDYLARVPEPRFLPDEDNIIPVLDDEYFEDDIVFRFHRFLEAALGKEGFSRNLRFIESALGMELRRYFNTKFYDDHLRRYKKRPIYWMVSSPGGSFKALIYMHRYNSQTMSKLFNDYLKEYRSKLAARLKDLHDGITRGANPVREEDRLNRAIKDTEDLILAITPLAMTPVEIDLDDGVKANLAKFRGVVVQAF